MAQLIKLENYISRYERDIFHYPGHYIRLKQENWKKLHHLWLEHQEMKIEEIEEDTSSSIQPSRWKSLFFKQSKAREEIDDYTDTDIDPVRPTTIDELKRYFLDSLLPFQLKWASSTVDKISFLDKGYETDELLKFFLQRLPDTFLVMFRPIFKLKKTVVEADIIIIHPVGIEIIKIFNLEPSKSIIVQDGRTWFTEENNIQTKMLNPMISAGRTEKIIKSILSFEELDFPIKKVMLSFENSIHFHAEPYNTVLIDKNNIETWIRKKQQFVSPLKRDQLKVSEALLRHCDTVAVPRPEWNQEKESEWE